jgi:alpha-tubulin suppressor-like RCC1 family protein
VTSVAGQGNHALYNEGGTLYACGNGAHGSLGDGSMAISSSPVKVDLPGPVSAETASWAGSGAVVDGVYYDWGYNGMGQLGNGTTQDSDVPVQVSLPAPVKEVFRGGDYQGDGSTLALLTDGRVFGWGWNTSGQLDLGTTTNHSKPVNVPALQGASEVVCGGSACYAILNGQLKGFGNGASGVLQKDGRYVAYITACSQNVAALRLN